MDRAVSGWRCRANEGLTLGAEVSPLDGIEYSASPEGDWELVRDVRLLALDDSPKAFLSSLALEKRWTESDWRRSLTTSTWLVAKRHGIPVGVLKTSSLPGFDDERYLEAMWVDPRHRMKSVGRNLVKRAIALAGGDGSSVVRLAVLHSNASAMGFFRELGFTEVVDPTPADVETQMTWCSKAAPPRGSSHPASDVHQGTESHHLADRG